MRAYLVLSGLILIAVLVILWETLRTRKQEPFQDVIVSGVQCPPGFQFFNDRLGASMCCKGRIDPATHKCMDTKFVDDMCSLAPNTPDPRNPRNQLSLCSDTIRREFRNNGALYCTPNLPYYSTDGTVAKCCANPAVNNGTSCSRDDLMDPKKYCVVKGTKQDGEVYCVDQKMDEQAGGECPAGFSKVSHIIGAREGSHYNVAIKDTKIPVCSNFTDSCMPESVLKHLKSKGLFTQKDAQTWKYACPAWIRRNQTKDETFAMDTQYP